MTATVVAPRTTLVIPNKDGDGDVVVSNQTSMAIVADISIGEDRPFLARAPEWREICADMIRASRDVEAIRMLGQKSKPISEYVAALEELHELVIKSWQADRTMGAPEQDAAILALRVAIIRIDQLRAARLAKQARIAEPNKTKRTP